VIIGPEGLAEDALAVANDVPLRAVRGERLVRPNIPSALFCKHLRILSAPLFAARIKRVRIRTPTAVVGRCTREIPAHSCWHRNRGQVTRAYDRRARALTQAVSVVEWPMQRLKGRIYADYEQAPAP
jgi:hypothetical protein